MLMLSAKTLLLLYAGLACSQVFASFQCARYCKEESDNFGYVIGKTFKYQYAANLRSLVNTSAIDDDESGFDIDSVIVFQPLSKCDYVMEILDVTIRGYYIKNGTRHDEERERFAPIATALKARPLHFAFNGRIETICPERTEAQEIVDLKRGMLSAFQNSNPTFKPDALIYETDITGNCETHYRVATLHDGQVRRVNKTKNLDACDHRMSHYLSWQTVPYMTSRNSKSLPLLKSTLHCVQHYGGVADGGGAVLQDSVCDERHVFQPFANGDNGAVTAITQKLQFVGAEIAAAYAPPLDVKRGTLICEYAADHTVAAGGEQQPDEALALLAALQRKTADGVDVEVPSLFSKLVFTFQRLSKAVLLEIFNIINQKQRKFYIDAISLVTSVAGIEVMSELYESKKLDDKQMNAWLVSLNFVKQPTRKTLQVIYPLSFHGKLRQNALLALTSSIHKYCSRQANCLDDVVILEIIKNIEKPLVSNCQMTSPQDKRDIFLALKAIGNAGLTTSYYNLQNCYLNNELPIELRLTAIAAHRRMRCAENENVDDFKALFANTRANSELRIAAYLASMQCASYALLAQVKDVLTKEPANQVGAFVWTHLTNLQETAAAWKQGARRLLDNEFLRNKFNTDARKYSRNYETSTFVDALGAGGGMEANVIFAAESYLPRSAMLNFTLDLFGETINVLELGARAEGFEDIVEHLFAKDDDYQQQRQQQQQQDRIVGDDAFKVLPRTPAGTMYARIFGNEIAYGQFNDLQELFGSTKANANKGLQLEMLMRLLRHGDIDYTKSFAFLDSAYRIPTVLGLPLQLRANGTATVGLTAGGEINVQDLWNYNMLIKGRVYPSVALQISGTMAVELATVGATTGVQYVGTLNSNMYIDGYANMELGKIVDIKVNVPKRQMDIFTLASDVYVLHNAEARPIRDAASNNIDNSEYCTDGYISKLTGLQFCNEWRFVNASHLRAMTPNFPLTGAFKYSMHIKKTDTFDFYQFYLETQLTSSSSSSSAKDQQYLINLVLDTPRSRVDRKLQCLLAADLQAYTLSAKMHSPFANFQLHSHIERELPKYKFQLLTTFNNKEVVALHSTFDVKDDGDMITYEPLAKINYKQQQIVALTGKLTNVKGGEYTADLRLEGLTEDVAQINGSFHCRTDAFHVQTSIVATHLKGDLEAALSMRPSEIHAKSLLTYNYRNNSATEERVVFVGRWSRATPTEGIITNTLAVDMQSTEWPVYNTNLWWQNQRAPLFFNNTAELTLFETTWSAHQIVKLDKGSDLLLLLDLVCPAKNIDYRSEMAFRSSKDLLYTRALVQLNKEQRLEGMIDLRATTKADTLHILVYYPQQTWNVDGALLKHTAQYGQYDYDLSCQHTAYGKQYTLFTLIGNYHNSSLGELQIHRINCTLDLPASEGMWRTPWTITSSVQKSHTMFLSRSMVATKQGDYAGHLNWIENSLALSVQADDKPLFVINGARTDAVVSAVLALNIHQHFELSAKLMQPLQSFDLQFYWDKDRDESRRFVFAIERNAFKGQYNMNVEYPNQKITTNIVLMPTQVIMNVTWGVKVSQRIYLKLGNTYYDVGGVWFGELETPFRYLERQRFTLKYYVVSDSFDVQSDLSWRHHSVNLLVSGSRSASRLAGNLQMNTTLPEIRRVGAAITMGEHRSDAAFDYNDHAVRAESSWLVTDGYRVAATFRIESPTQTIDPIFGALQLNDGDSLDAAYNANLALHWQRKNMTARCSFKSDASSIEIDTPFVGIEKTQFQYAVVSNSDTVYLSTTVDLFKQNNSITLSWTNTPDSTSCSLDMMSPMTGRYFVSFSHSALLGSLKETFRIQGPEDKDLLRMKIEGDIIRATMMNVTASLVLLDHDALITIANTQEPLQSNVVAIWNGRKVDSHMQLHFGFDNELERFQWLVDSNLFAPVQVSYVTDGQARSVTTKIELPQNYSLTNYYQEQDDHLWSNRLHLQTPIFVVDLNHKQAESTLNQSVIARLGENRIESNITACALPGDWRLDGNYAFYMQEQVLHSHTVHGSARQDGQEEELRVEVNSTFGGVFHVLHRGGNSSRFEEHSLTMTLNIPAYCSLELIANNKETVWKDKLNDKSLGLNYGFDERSMRAELISSYEEIPNGSLELDHKSVDKMIYNARLGDYSLELEGDPKNLVVVARNASHRMAEVKFHFDNAKRMQCAVTVNEQNGHLSYQFADNVFRIDSAIGKYNFSSRNSLQEPFKALITFANGDDLYIANLNHNKGDLDLNLRTPNETYIGKLYLSTLLEPRANLHFELSSLTSTNRINISGDIFQIHASAISDYCKLPQQEIEWQVIMQPQLMQVQGSYKNQSATHKFTLQSQSTLRVHSFIYRLPDDTIYLSANLTATRTSPTNFETALDAKWAGHRLHLDAKNHFGDYYQTTFNLLTPIRGWARTSFDCTINERKIGLAFAVKSHHMSLIARKTGSELLRVEYMGETLLEVSSSEGHMTLRTTSRFFGAYRLFVQATHTPGIYVFTILKDGENLLSFMLQNYSANGGMHYKGKLMAPQNASALSVEFIADASLSKRAEFKVKRNTTTLLEIAWRNLRMEENLEDAYLTFQSEIEGLPRLRLHPVIRNRSLAEVDINMRYPCKEHEECVFQVELQPSVLHFKSIGNEDYLNFEVLLNATMERSQYLHINGLGQFRDHSSMFIVYARPEKFEMELTYDFANVRNGYFLHRMQQLNDRILIDLELPQIVSANGNVSLTDGFITIAKPKVAPYEMSWKAEHSAGKQLILADLSKNSITIAKLVFDNAFVATQDIRETNTTLLLNYGDYQLDGELQACLTATTAKLYSSLKTPFEPIRNTILSTKLDYVPEEINLDYNLQVDDEEFLLNAIAASNAKGQTMHVQYKPFARNAMNKTISAQYLGTHTNKTIYRFDVDLGDANIYKVHAQLTGDRGNYIHVKTAKYEEVAMLKFDGNTFDLRFKNDNAKSPVKSFDFRVQDNNVLVEGNLFGYENTFFVQKYAFGILTKQTNNNGIHGFAYKWKYNGSPLRNYNDFNEHERMIDAHWKDHRWGLFIDQTKTAFQMRYPGRNIMANYENQKDRHLLTMKSGDTHLGQFTINKDFSKIHNEIHTPFAIEFGDKSLHITQEHFNATINATTRNVRLKMGEHSFRFETGPATIQQDFYLYYANRNDGQIIVHLRPQTFIITIGNFALDTWFENEQVRAKVDFRYGNQPYLCNIAGAANNITFKLTPHGGEPIVHINSYFGRNLVRYYFHIPSWEVVRLVDLEMFWTNDAASKKHFQALFSLDSQYASFAGETHFDLQPEALFIDTLYRTPLLSTDRYQATVNITAGQLPYVLIAIPQHEYKFYHQISAESNMGEFGIICRNRIFHIRAVKNSSVDIDIDLVFPDERFRTFSLTTSNASQLLQVAFNKVYTLKAKWDLSNIALRTPIIGYEKLGYHFEQDFNQNRGLLRLQIDHPQYSEPLGVLFYFNLIDQSELSMFEITYKINSPIKIENQYDFVDFNMSLRLKPNAKELDGNFVTNGIKNSFKLDYLLTDTRKAVSCQAIYNGTIYLSAVFAGKSQILLIVGNPHEDEMQALENVPNFENYDSPRLHLFYMSLGDGGVFDLTCHNPLQPFSFRRTSNTYAKLIWDLRRANDTMLGGRIEDNRLEMYLADNLLVMEKKHPTRNEQQWVLNWNKAVFEYRRTADTHELHSPLGIATFSQQTDISALRRFDRIELSAGSALFLAIDNEITIAGNLATTIHSSLLPHDVVLIVNASRFHDIPSIFEASLAYSNTTDKTIHFRMYYNKSYADERVTTDRVFVLRQPASMIDYELYFNAMRTQDFSNGSVVLRYQDFDEGRREQISASARVEHGRFGVHGAVDTSRNHFGFVAKSTAGAKRHGFLIHIDINDKDPLNLECNYDFRRESPSVSLMAAYGTSRKYVFYAGLPNEKEITAKLGHELYGKASLDALAIMRLNTSQLLWMKVLWKDHLYAPFHEAIFDEYNDLRFVIEATGKQLIDVIHDDIGKEFVRDFAEMKRAVVNRTMTRLEATLNGLQSKQIQCTNSSNFLCKVLHENERFIEFANFLRTNLSVLYETMDKIFQSSMQAIRLVFEMANLEIEKAMKDIKNIQNIKVDAKAILKRGINTARKSLKEMEAIAVGLLDDFDKYVESVKDQLGAFFEPFLSLVDDFIAYIEQRLTVLQVAILDTLDTVQRYIFDLREIRTLVGAYAAYVNWLEELHVIDVLEPVGDVIEEALATLSADVRRVLDHCRPYLDALGDALFGRYDGIRSLPPVVEVRDHVNRIYHKTVWVWNYHNMTAGLKDAVQKFSKDVDSVLSFVDNNGDDSAEELDYAFGYNYVFRPENRLIEISQPLPVEWQAFNTSPSFENYPLYQRIQGKSEQFVKFYKSRYDLIDMLENFVVDLYEPSIAPSTNNYAMIIGKTQYFTFNGLNYNFLSNCSYLLAADFKTNSFSLIVNYRNTSSGVVEKSYEIITNDARFEIFSDSNITVDGLAMDVPIVHKQVTIVRERENIIAESARGFKLACYFRNDFCTVQLSGWLFGKTAGLLGTLDNEQTTDSLTSHREPSATIAEFLHSWQLPKEGNKVCALTQSPYLLPLPDASTAEWVGHACDLFFANADSPLRRCFDVVPPEEYRAMCRNEMRAKVCAPAAAYVHRCRKAKVAIEMPSVCVTCDNDIGYTEEIFDGQNNKTVDVVFLTELDCYNATGLTSYLPTLLNAYLETREFTANRFAAIGFGGNTLPKPHVQTFHGNVWISSADGMQIKTTLAGSNTNTKSKFTAIDAIKYATNLEYRVGVSKLFVLTQCEVATDIGNSPDVYNMLGERDIVLHVLKPLPFGRNHRRVMGMDMQATYVNNSQNELQIGRNHNEILNDIDDVYVGLALSTNGTVYDLHNVYTASTLAEAWAYRVAARVERSPCQKCKCVQDVDGVGRIECVRCLAPAVKNFLHEYEEGNKMKFDDNDN